MATAGISGQPQGMPWGATGTWYATFAVRHGQSGQQQSIVEAAFRAALRLPPIQGPVADDGRLPMIESLPPPLGSCTCASSSNA